MLSFFSKIQRTIIFAVKSLLFFLLMLLFFAPYMINVPLFTYIPGLLNASRTMAICYITFVVVGIAFIKIYGGLAIGLKKSKEIIPSVFLATIVTDLITWVQLIIMSYKRIEHPFHMILPLIISVFFQYICIYSFTRFGNFLFFTINPPKTCTVIYKEEKKVRSYIAKIGRYKKQWAVKDVVYYKNPNLKECIKKNESVFIFDLPHGERNDILEYCYKKNKNIYILPDIADIIVKHSKNYVVDDVAMFVSTLSELSFEQKVVKRLMDIIVSAVGIVLSSPIMLIEAIAIKLYDKGPVLFKQERMTEGGRVFSVYKFRTMIVEAEKDNVAVLSQKNDSRITPVGRVLRALRLDELPQLFNVLKGDMSFVGPRPERESIANEYSKELPEFYYRLKVKAGLTGLAQVLGKYNTTPKDKLILDLAYIEQYSIWLDLKILFQTFMVLFKSDSTEGFGDDDRVEFVKHDKSYKNDYEKKGKKKNKSKNKNKKK